MKDPDILRISKWGAGILIPLLIGGIAWANKVENRLATSETIQTQTVNNLLDIRDDIRNIRDVLIQEIKKR